VRLGYVGVSLTFAAAYLIAAGDNLAQSIIYVGSSLAAAVAILVAVWINRPARPEVWYVLAAGQTVYAVANGYWLVVPAISGRPVPFPSPAAWVFVVSYLIIGFALLRLIRARRAGADRSALLDALVVTSTFSSVNYVLVVEPTRGASELSPLGVLDAGAYALMDTVLLVLVSRLLFGAVGHVNGTLVLLAAWAGALLAADVYWGVQQIMPSLRGGSWAYGYLASYVLLGAAALHPGIRDVAARHEPAGTAGRARLVMLGLCGLVVPALAVNAVRDGELIEPIVLSCASAVMFVLLMLRVADLLAQTTAAAHREYGILRGFLAAVPVGLAVHDADTGEPAYVNRAATHLLGYAPGKLSSTTHLPNLYVCGTDQPYPPDRLPTARALRGEEASVDDVEVAVDTTRRRRMRLVGTPIRDGDRLRYALSAFIDITAEREMAEELRQLSVRDELTGVNNRRGFLLEARARLALIQREYRTATLFYVDLDGLKAINDTYGHGVGDDAIRDAAVILSASIRLSDVLGRVGGDEFCLLLTDVGTRADVDVWVRRLHAQVELHNSSSNRPYRLMFTVGCTVFDPATPCTVEDLMHRADEAMYGARHARRGVTDCDST
jgi:diguanylate cyclase (GGDEF)-like protein